MPAKAGASGTRCGSDGVHRGVLGGVLRREAVVALEQLPRGVGDDHDVRHEPGGVAGHAGPRRGRGLEDVDLARPSGGPNFGSVGGDSSAEHPGFPGVDVGQALADFGQIWWKLGFGRCWQTLAMLAKFSQTWSNLADVWQHAWLTSQPETLWCVNVSVTVSTFAKCWPTWAKLDQHLARSQPGCVHCHRGGVAPIACVACRRRRGGGAGAGTTSGSRFPHGMVWPHHTAA